MTIFAAPNDSRGFNSALIPPDRAIALSGVSEVDNVSFSSCDLDIIDGRKEKKRMEIAPLHILSYSTAERAGPGLVQAESKAVVTMARIKCMCIGSFCG
jgi:hypothetical protein